MSARRWHRWWWLVQQALDEAWHLRAGQAIVLAALALAAGASVLREFNFGAAEARFLCDFAEGTIALFGTVLAIVLGVALVQGGLTGGAAALVLVRGVRRPEWLVARWVAICVALLWLVLPGYGVLGAMLAWCGHEFSAAALARAAGLLFLRLSVTAGFAVLACVVARGLVLAAVLALALALAAQLAPVIGWAQHHGGHGGRLGWTLLGRLVPNFAVFDGGYDLWRAAVYAVGFVLLYLTAACLVFSRREL